MASTIERPDLRPTVRSLPVLMLTSKKPVDGDSDLDAIVTILILSQDRCTSLDSPFRVMCVLLTASALQGDRRLLTGRSHNSVSSGIA